LIFTYRSLFSHEGNSSLHPVCVSGLQGGPLHEGEQEGQDDRAKRDDDEQRNQGEKPAFLQMNQKGTMANIMVNTKMKKITRSSGVPRGPTEAMSAGMFMRVGVGGGVCGYLFD